MKLVYKHERIQANVFRVFAKEGRFLRKAGKLLEMGIDLKYVDQQLESKYLALREISPLLAAAGIGCMMVDNMEQAVYYDRLNVILFESHPNLLVENCEHYINALNSRQKNAASYAAQFRLIRAA